MGVFKSISMTRKQHTVYHMLRITPITDHPHKLSFNTSLIRRLYPTSVHSVLVLLQWMSWI